MSLPADVDPAQIFVMSDAITRRVAELCKELEEEIEIKLGESDGTLGFV